MFYLKQLLATAMGLCIAHTALAQHHYNAWFRGTITLPLNEKINLDNELQHRRQNGFENSNLLDEDLMNNYRLWLHYQHSEDVKFSVSPFAYFSNYKIIQDATDNEAKPINEIRFSAALELQHEIFSNLFIMDRTAIEYRSFLNNSNNLTRLRNRLGLRYNLSSKMKLFIFDERLFNVNGVGKHHFFDHERLGFNMQYEVLPKVKLDIGMMHIARMPLKSDVLIKESNLFFNINYLIGYDNSLRQKSLTIN